MEDRYLFKAKHFKEWHVGNIVKEPDGLYIRDIKENAMVYIDDESSICQCTGLKDDNDTLIFENDVLSLADKVSDYEWKAVVKFGNPDSNDTWGWHLVPITECYVNREILLWVETELNTVECRVIGNMLANDCMGQEKERV